VSKLYSVIAAAACLLAPTLVLPVAGSAWAEGTPVRVRGTVVSLDGSKLVVHTKDGKDATVSLKDKYAALAVVKSSMDEIKEGTFIGTATEPQPDGSLRAVEVVVFPETLRGFAEGHYPWDLGPKSMMTNATIAQKVQKVDGETVDVTYKGGEKKITIPSNIPIVGLVPLSTAISSRVRTFLFPLKNRPMARCSQVQCCSAKASCLQCKTL
jgi:hypothetical protein